MFDLKARGKIILSLILFVAVCVAGYFIYQYLHPTQPVTYESQTQAETSTGVKKAASNAKVPMSDGQAIEISEDIKQAAQRKPDSVVNTTGANITKEIENQRVQAKADFAIVTEPSKPDTLVDVKKLPANEPVVLNQYNIKAYPGHQWSATYYANKAVDVSWQMRIGKSGTYIGPAVMCNDGKVTYGVRVTGTY